MEIVQIFIVGTQMIHLEQGTADGIKQHIKAKSCEKTTLSVSKLHKQLRANFKSYVQFLRRILTSERNSVTFLTTDCIHPKKMR